MTMLVDSILLHARTEAERLWRGSLEARGHASEDVVALCEALDLGVRTVEILAVEALQPARDRFPATIGTELEQPEPEVQTHRDAVTVPKSIDFTEILDLLSDEALDCVGPRLHRGWEDRAFSCRRSRALAQETLGVTLGAAEREDLLRLAAYRNRLFRLPPPVRVVPDEIVGAFPALDRLVDKLS